MFEQRRVREEAVKRQHDKITEKVMTSSGQEISVRTKLNEAIDIPEMPEMPDFGNSVGSAEVGIAYPVGSGGSVAGDLSEMTSSMYGQYRTDGREELTAKAKQDIVNMISSMSEYEQKLVVESLPIDICLQRIKDELDRQRSVIDAINNAMRLG